MKILVTGGNGFIGHHFCEHVLKNTDWEIIVLDKMTYASFGFDRLRDVQAYDSERVKHFCHDITLPIEEGLLKEISDVDYLIHMAAETHVENSIYNAYPFVMTNVLGTLRILEFAMKCKNLKKMIYFSTDEVFGPAGLESPGFREWERYNSSNPYAATKAGGEELCLAFANTHRVPVTITHTMNAFGERQHPEKFIPKVVRACLTGDKVYIHADATKTVPGSRFWIHCRNIADAVLFILRSTPTSLRKINIVGEVEIDNLKLAKFISEIVGRSLNMELVDFHSSRPGHDLRYALDGNLLCSLGYLFPRSFEDSIKKTVEWTLKNPKWLNLEDGKHVDIT